MKLLKYSTEYKAPRTLGNLQSKPTPKIRQPKGHEVKAKRYDERVNVAAMELAGVWNRR